MYTTALNVRKQLPDLLIGLDLLAVTAGGHSVYLNRAAVDVPTVSAQGATYVKNTGFTFYQPRTLYFIAELGAYDYLATCYYSVTDADLEERINASDRVIAAYFAKNGLPDGDRLSDWSARMTAARWLGDHANATEENINRARDMEKRVYSDMENYKKENSIEQSARTNYKYIVRSS